MPFEILATDEWFCSMLFVPKRGVLLGIVLHKFLARILSTTVSGVIDISVPIDTSKITSWDMLLPGHMRKSRR